MADSLIIPQHIFDKMIAHCRSGLPNEACGILSGTGNQVSEIRRMTNIEDSPVSYLMDSMEQFKLMKELRRKDLLLLAIFHSHPSSSAYPSQKDVSLASYEDTVYIIVSFSGTDPVAKGFSIREGNIEEVGLVITNVHNDETN